MPLSADDQERIRPYCSNLDRSVFALSGLPEEVIAVLFAYYSRSRDDLRTNLARLLAEDELAVSATRSRWAAGDAPERTEHPEPEGGPEGPEGHRTSGLARTAAEEKARAFHEKWVVGYGHSSVAEHACVHLAVENVSILCAKAIEDLRLGSYTEKSTRYVQFQRDSFVTPPELPPKLRALHQETASHLFDTYLALFPVVESELRARVPRQEKQTERGHATAIHAQACDLLRGLLPAGTRTNLGLTVNARALAALLCKMLASPLQEVREVAALLHREALAIAPTLVRYVAASEHRKALREGMPPLVSSLGDPQGDRSGDARGENEVALVHVDEDALRQVALALAYEAYGAHASAERLVRTLAASPATKCAEIIAAAMRTRGRFDGAPRAFEMARITLEMTLDYGAYRDLQRHRMATQWTQTLGAGLGAEVPEELAMLGGECNARMRAALDRAARAWRALAADHPDEAQYVVPLAFRMRTLWTCNLRELVHVIELRSARQGHSSYRKMAHRLYALVEERLPWLAPHVRVDRTPYHALARG